MTEKEKTKAYDKAIERAKKELDACGLQDCDAARQIFRLFPELKESEDEWVEKIRKDIISYLKHRQIKSIIESGATERWITYLEKQGQLKSAFEMKTSEERTSEKYNKTVDTCFYGDNVETKFKVGDWCIDNEDGTIFQIVKVLNDTYVYRTNEGRKYFCTHCSLENDSRLWNIVDAKDGDVLCTYECGTPKIVLILKGTPKKYYALSYALGYHCYYNIMYSYFESNSEKGCLAPGGDVKPATKEQRDLLFQKMEESGYKWNDKGNEPKKTQLTEFKDAVKDMMNDFDDNMATVEKIKERVTYLLSLILIRQNPDWSEEDENLFKCAIDIVKQESKVRSDGCLNEEVGEMVINWLRAFKDRMQPKQKWKPNEEQIKAFEFMIQSWGESGTLSPYDGTMNYLLSLLNDLKKL